METPLHSGNNESHQRSPADSSAAFSQPSTRLRTFFRLLISLILLIAGGVLGIGGFRLLLLGGSDYYLVAGGAYVIGAILLYFRLRISAHWAILTFIATIVWAVYDSPALTYWDLVPRLGFPAFLMLLTLWSTAYLPKVGKLWRSIQFGISLLTFIALGATFGASFYPHDQFHATGKIPDLSLLPGQSPNWTNYGRNAEGTRFAPSHQITPANVHDLKVAWVYHTGRRISGSNINVDENTPLQVGNTLYSCTPEHIVTALNGDTGRSLWRFDPHTSASPQVRCRSVAYYNINQDSSLSPEQKSAYTQKQCRARILVSTADGRLIALDATTGKACDDFGQHGTVALQSDASKDQGATPSNTDTQYAPSSSPIVAGHLVIMGGWEYTPGSNIPTGSVRAYSAITGQPAWNWTLNGTSTTATNETTAPATTGSDPAPRYAMNTPSVWATPTYDSTHNLIFVPTGSTPHSVEGEGSFDTNDKYRSAVVALDANTGKVRWVYQTVHHDLWGYNLPSQPVLTYVNNDQGQSVQALIQTTRTGNIFVLDPLTGQPITEVDDQQVPNKSHVTGETLAATQPYSTGMPRIGADVLSENGMWGLTPFDQMVCRIKYKQSSYQGDFTPPTSSRPYIQFPGVDEGMNWGGISVDPMHQLMFVNDMRVAMQLRLHRHQQGESDTVQVKELKSPLGVPCLTPPFGTLNAINLNTHQLVWQEPIGSIQDSRILGIATHLNIPVGLPTSGGPTSTASGLLFLAGTRDHYLRAINEQTGHVVWKTRLPEGATAAPLVYTSPTTGKEYVVISAGGARHSKHMGDAIIAYALPDKLLNEHHE